MDKKYVLITGATKGIGLAVAKVFAAEGYPVILTYQHNQEAASEALQILPKTKLSHYALRADASSYNSIEIIASFLEDKQINSLDTLVLNAGVTNRKDLEHISFEEWEEVFRTNLNVPVFLIKRLIHLLKNGGNIIVTGSTMGCYPHSTSLAYGVSKSSLHALVTNLTKTLEHYAIRINAVAPGFVETKWQQTKAPELKKSIENKIALHRFASAEEIAQVYLFIRDHEYINSSIIPIDGGYSYK